MRDDKDVKDDILSEYLRAGDREPAPEGFSSKIMSHVYMETKPVRKEKTYGIPVISAVVFLALIIAAMLIPHDTFTLPFNLPGSFSIAFPDIPDRKLPLTAGYIITGIIIIALFDSALNLIFRRKNNL
ncbi:MAG TPA: hypothetical protein VHO46_11150 [Bacteroidales bacterium]|nr:hypothetical protein [Bacteroidales bacterium]